jgi:predicted phage tail component-like protein
MITLDGKRPSELGFVVLADHKNDMLPEVENVTLSIPGRHGLYYLDSRFNARTFEIPCGIIQQKTWGDLQHIVRRLASFFVDPYGKPRAIKLKFDYEPDKFYIVRYSGSLSIERLIRLGRFTLSLTAYDPFAKFVVPSDEIIMDSDVPILSDITLDAVYTFQVRTPQTIQVINDGNIAVRPTIFINGITSRLSIQNTDTNQSFYINNINQPVEVNGENYTVKIGGVSSLSALKGDFIELLPGVNNIMVDPSGSTVQLTFRFYHQYM